VLASQAPVALLAFARAATLFVARASIGLVSIDVTATGLALFWRIRNRSFVLNIFIGMVVFLLEHFWDLFESKWLHKYTMNMKYIHSDRANILVFE